MRYFDLFKRNATPASQPEPGPGQQLVTFAGLGMHCGGCRTSIELALRDVPGVTQFHVDLDRQTAAVVFDPAQTDVNALQRAVEDAGFTPTSRTVSEG